MTGWNYKTVQGDTWDSIALDAYGTEMLAGYIQQANIGYTNLAYFPSGITLFIPATPEEAKEGLKAPWKRVVESAEYPAPVGRLILDYSNFVHVAGTSDHNALRNRDKENQHSTAAIFHGTAKEPLEQFLERLVKYIREGGPFLEKAPEGNTVYFRDEPLEF